MAFRIEVAVKPNAKRAAVVKISETEYRVFVHAPPQQGEANRALIVLLADYFSVPKSTIKIVRGLASRKKILEPDDGRGQLAPFAAGSSRARGLCLFRSFRG